MAERNLPHELGGDTGYSPPSEPQTNAPPAVPPQPYYAGLEVAPSQAPEWTPSTGQESSLGHKIPVEPPHYKKDEEAGANAPMVAGGGASKPWWKRKLILAIVGAALIIAIGLGVGLGVGLSSGGGSDSSNGSEGSSDGNNSGGGDGDGAGDGDSKDSDSPCKNNFCSRLLAVSLHLDTLFVFARSSDKKSITFRSFDGSEWADWEDLGSTSSSELRYPPSAQNWMVNASYWRLDLFAIDEGGRPYNNWLTEEEDWPKWEEIGDNVGSPITTCAVHRDAYPDELDLWAVEKDSGDIAKTGWQQYDDEDIDDEGFEGITEATGQYGSNSGWSNEGRLGSSYTQPAVICALSNDDSERYHDVMWYDKDGSKVYHSSYTGDDGWSTKVDFPGRWIGEPSLSTANAKRNDGYFFGVQENHEIYHLSWDENHSFSKMESLGGDVHSPPGVNSEDDGEALDIVALGGNGTLVHLYKDRTGWEAEWEDLGVESASAPAVRAYHGTMFIFVVSADGELISYEKDDDSPGGSWKEKITMRNLGGDLSLEY